MKILFINTVCGYGSTGRICTDIADLLLDQGHACKIAYGRGDMPEKYRAIAKRIGSPMDVEIHAGLARLTDSAGFHSKKATKNLLLWIDEWKPDLIHLHNLHGYYINVEMLFQYLSNRKIPVVWTLHDCWPFTGHCTYFDHAKCDKWKSGCKGGCPQKKEYPSSIGISRSETNYLRKMQAFSNIDILHVVTPSYWLERLVKQSFLQKYKTHVIHNGIDLETFQSIESDFRERYGVKDKRIYLAVSDGWGRRKGLDDVIKMAKLLTPEERIVMVGVSGKEKTMIPDEVIAIPRTKNVKELVEIYSAADVFINPTYEDNYPTTNLEAQACGIPVVTYNTGGSPESVPKENVVPKGDYIELLKLARQYHLLKVNYMETFDKNKTFSEYIGLFCKILQNMNDALVS